MESTFQEMRSHRGLPTTRRWSKQTVVRTASSSFLLYTIVAVFYDTLAKRTRHLRIVTRESEQDVTFSYMIVSVPLFADRTGFSTAAWWPGCSRTGKAYTA